MSIEQPKQVSRKENLLGTLKTNPENFSDLEASMLLLEVGYSEFESQMSKLAKRFPDKKLSLIFSLDDPDFGKNDAERVWRLRSLKAMRENSDLNKIITSITVKGSKGQRMLEPNVFSSDVKFEVI